MHPTSIFFPISWRCLEVFLLKESKDTHFLNFKSYMIVPSLYHWFDIRYKINYSARHLNPTKSNSNGNLKKILDLGFHTFNKATVAEQACLFANCRPESWIPDSTLFILSFFRLFLFFCSFSSTCSILRVSIRNFFAFEKQSEAFISITNGSETPWRKKINKNNKKKMMNKK